MRLSQCKNKIELHALYWATTQSSSKHSTATPQYCGWSSTLFLHRDRRNEKYYYDYCSLSYGGSKVMRIHGSSFQAFHFRWQLACVSLRPVTFHRTPLTSSLFPPVLFLSRPACPPTPVHNRYCVCCRRFPWDSIPGVVIGRVAYDNWLVLNAIQQKQVVVDVSKTVLAVHQTTKWASECGNAVALLRVVGVVGGVAWSRSLVGSRGLRAAVWSIQSRAEL